MARYIRNGSVMLLIVLVGVPAMAGTLAPRKLGTKPERTTLSPSDRVDAISVKFRDDLAIQAADGRLTGRGASAIPAAAQALLAQFPGGRWERSYPLDENRLEQLRVNAQGNLGKAVADLRTQFNFTLPAGVDPAKAIDALNSLDVVEIALPLPRPVTPPQPPNFQAFQGYLDAPTVGIGAVNMWSFPNNATGYRVRIADIEYSWNFNHQDLAIPILLGPAPVDPFNDNRHGTAVLGVLASLNNGWGTTGIAWQTNFGTGRMYVAAANTASGLDVGAAVLNAAASLSPGDVILIELQTAGPNYTGSPPGTQVGLVPVEWYQPWYNAIVATVGNNITVLEAAGNGFQNLDDPIYSVGNGGHHPFRLENDSGAIMIGAGGAPGSPNGTRSRLSFSNYGATVDLQGWGEAVVTTGYGNSYSAEGVNLEYTNTFNGTSAALPIVSGACALLQDYYQAHTNQPLPPAAVKAILRDTGSPQLDGPNPATQHIGPLPNLNAAIATLDFTPPNPNPPSFAMFPTPVSETAITMSSVPVSDIQSPPVQYYFRSDFGAGGHDSGWIATGSYTDTALAANTVYGYSIKARDSAPNPNETAMSGGAATATLIETPAGVGFGSITNNSIAVNALGTFTNLSLGQSALYFEMSPDVPGSGTNMWVQAASIVAGNLAAGTTYSFRIKARNQNGVETGFCILANQTTSGPSAPCDCDGNGLSEAGPDTACFEAVLLGRNQNAGSLSRMDFTGDGRVNGADIQPFLSCILGGGGCTGGQATNPTPLDQAQGVPVNVVLQWMPGPGATSSDVYLGTNATAVASATVGSPEFLGNTPGSSFMPTGSLMLNTGYYWRVDSRGMTGACPGIVWHFSTGPAQASNPSPPDNATGVDMNVMLAWMGGAGATQHDVYLGTTQFEVENATTGTPGVYRGRQFNSSYSPGFLSPATTYYWRIDEIGTGPDATKGTVWRFSTVLGPATSPSPTNGASGVPVTTTLGWFAAMGSFSHDVYLGTDLSSVSNASTASPEFRGNSFSTSFWPGMLNGNTTYYWRIDEVASDGITRSHGDIWQFSTIAPPQQAANPTPPDFSSGVSLFASLNWSAAINAESYDVYWGTDESAVSNANTTSQEFRGTQFGTMFSPVGLSNQTTYFWRIDSRNAAGATAGLVWRFTTG